MCWLRPWLLFLSRWESVITHVPCGDGILVVETEWRDAFKINAPQPRDGCPQISGGAKLSNSKGIQSGKKRNGVWDSFILHEMAHGIGFG